MKAFVLLTEVVETSNEISVWELRVHGAQTETDPVINMQLFLHSENPPYDLLTNFHPNFGLTSHSADRLQPLEQDGRV